MPDVAVRVFEIVAALQECWELKGSRIFSFRKNILTDLFRSSLLEERRMSTALPEERAHLLLLSSVYSPSNECGSLCLPPARPSPLGERSWPGMRAIPDLRACASRLYAVSSNIQPWCGCMGSTISMSAGRRMTSASVSGEYTIRSGYLPRWEMCALGNDTRHTCCTVMLPAWWNR